ncbi:MAG: hypothetical protein WDN25_04025 [Acetobacteraceae bacterium]
MSWPNVPFAGSVDGADWVPVAQADGEVRQATIDQITDALLPDLPAMSFIGNLGTAEAAGVPCAFGDDFINGGSFLALAGTLAGDRRFTGAVVVDGPLVNNSVALGLAIQNAASNYVNGAVQIGGAGAALDVGSSFATDGTQTVANSDDITLNGSEGVFLNGPANEVHLGPSGGQLTGDWEATGSFNAVTLLAGGLPVLTTAGSGVAVSGGTVSIDNQATVAATGTTTVTPAAGTTSVLVNMGSVDALVNIGSGYPGQHLRLEIKQGGTPHAVTLGTAVVYGSIPSFTASGVASARDLLQLICLDGTRWALAAVNQGFTI